MISAETTGSKISLISDRLGIFAGVSILVGRDSDKIFAEADRLLNNSVDYFTMTLKDNPYGDGKSAEMIVKILGDKFNG